MSGEGGVARAPRCEDRGQLLDRAGHDGVRGGYGLRVSENMWLWRDEILDARWTMEAILVIADAVATRDAFFRFLILLCALGGLGMRTTAQ